MTVQYRPWLPQNAIKPHELASIIDDAVLEWSECWSPALKFDRLKLLKNQGSSQSYSGAPLPHNKIARGTSKTAGKEGIGKEEGVKAAIAKDAKDAKAKAAKSKEIKNRQKIAAKKKIHLQYHLLSEELAIGYTPDVTLSLALKLLGIDIPAARVSQIDKPVLLKLSELCLRDLRARIRKVLADWLNRDADMPDFAKKKTDLASLQDGFWSGEITSKCKTFRLGFAMHENILIRHRQASIQQAHLNNQAMNRNDAVGACMVDIGAKLGTAVLTFSELNDLEIDDVLILDSAVEANVDLVVNGQVEAVAACALQQDKDGFQLEIK